jgi:hypothetical protein
MGDGAARRGACASRLFVGFSDNRQLAVVVRFVVFVLAIIILGVPAASC